MSNSILPHLLSDSPPPLVADDEEFEDEFGDFKGSEELSFDNENSSTPSSLKNSTDYFPDTYTDFNLCNVEERFQVIETPEDKSTRNTDPPNNYFTLWEQIENNIPEIIDEEENPPNVKEIVDSVENGEDFCQSVKNDYTNGTGFEDEIPTKRTEEYCEETAENKTFSELSDSLEESEVSNEIKLSNEDNSTKITFANEIEFNNSFENCDIDSTLAEINLAPVFHSLETEKHDDQSIEEIKNEKINVEDQISESIGNHAIHEDHSSVGVQHADSSKSDSKKSNEFYKVQDSLLSTVNENLESDDDFGEFADFSSSKLNDIPVSETRENIVKSVDEDDFDEFESYQTTSVSQTDIAPLKSCDFLQEPSGSTQDMNTEEIDDFDDFTSYSEQDKESTEVSKDCESHTSDIVIKICKSPEEAFKEAQNVLEKLFPVIENTTPEYSNYDFITNNSIFENLKEITETNALTYQWGKSTAQKNILRTLNIDIRNILYGPTWNSGMPIFAPNLCSKPLEPTKSELPIPISPQKTFESQESTTSTTPQFDWSGSGLTDLQDSSLNNDKEFHTTMQTPIGEFEVIKPTYVDPTPIPQKLEQFEGESSPTRKLEVNTVCQDINDDFSDFTSYQGGVEEDTKWKTMLPLRESHISSSEHQDNLETDKISLYFQELTMGKSEPVLNDHQNLNPKILSNESSLGMFEKEQFPSEPPFVFNDLKKIESKTKLEEFPKNNTSENNVHFETQVSTNHCDMSFDDFTSFKSEEANKIKGDTIVEEKSTKHHEDEFTDFQSSLPSVSEHSVQPTLLEPLKPAILQPEPIKNKSLKIEWPEPGLDEDEINRIVNGVLRKNSTHENVTEKTKNPVQNEPNLTNTVQKTDHDDWSDFISVKEPLKSRTSTPDLPLSVFNLASIQPNKVSAPFITPNGVVHSPSKTPNRGFPVVNRNLQNGAQQNLHHHPFITSQAFGAFTKNSISQPSTSRKSVANKQSNPQFSYDDKMNISANRLEQNNGRFSQSFRNHKDQHQSNGTFNNTEDDDWGDFVSAPNTISHSNSSANFFQPLSYMKTNLGFGSKPAPTQKFPSVPKNTVVKQERNNFPVISTMPDLDFVSPKSRSSIK